MFNLERPCFRKNQIIMKFLLTPLLAGLLLSGSLFAQTNGGGTGTTQDNGSKVFGNAKPAADDSSPGSTKSLPLASILISSTAACAFTNAPSGPTAA